MTPLGLSAAELVPALGRYQFRLAMLIEALGASAPMTLHNAAFPAVEDLGAMIDVDIGARAAPSGQARTSELERAVLVPLLHRRQTPLAGLAPTLPSRACLFALRAAKEDIAGAERTFTDR